MLNQAIAWLQAQDIAPLTLALSVAIFLTVFTLRKLAPGFWTKLVGWVPSLGFDETPVWEVVHKFVQSLPALVLSAVVSAASTGGNFTAALWLALAGPLSVLIHEFLKAVPAIPYTGALGKVKPPNLPLLCFAFAFWTAFFLGGCSLFGSGGALAPLASCAPSPAELVNEVALILLSGSDYKAKLINLALKDGENAIDCAVAAAVKQLEQPTARQDEEHHAALDRGRAYLSERGRK